MPRFFCKILQSLIDYLCTEGTLPKREIVFISRIGCAGSRIDFVRWHKGLVFIKVWEITISGFGKKTAYIAESGEGCASVRKTKAVNI